MERSYTSRIISAIVIILLLAGAIYYLISSKGTLNPDAANQTESDDATTAPTAATQPMKVVVENSRSLAGKLSLPAEFPSSIPVETANITESATTRFPEQNAIQLSLSYKSSKSIIAKYEEYKAYMTEAGYSVTEGDARASVRSIFGTKADANFTVAISNSGSMTLVQISYLMK